VSSNVSAHEPHLSDAGAQSLVEHIRYLKPSSHILTRNWWPVIVWLGIIRLESTDVASSANTSGLLYAVLSFLVPHINPQSVELINEVLRKTGHFLGYGILGALVFFALRNTNRDRNVPLLLRRWGMYLHDLWRMEWVLLGMGVTVITASLDEIHQSFMASRTGRWQDVVLDACGAAVLQIFIYFFSLRALDRRRQHVGQPEFSPTP
jgi:VanZ family protein